MSKSAERLLQLLQLEKIEENLYRGQHEERPDIRLFGGQVLAQALRAACSTVDQSRSPHAIHAYFLKAGSFELPVLYEVDRIRDGGSFTTRRVVAIQGGEAIFNMEASFHKAESGWNHAALMPNVPTYDELEDDVAVVRALDTRDPRISGMARIERPFELRSVFRPGSDAWAMERRWNPVWMRYRVPVAADDPAVASCLLAYASDMGMVSTATLPRAEAHDRSRLRQASLDHALWIHRPVPINGWLLFHKHTNTAQAARGLNHGEFFAEDGTLVASVAQEGLMRFSA